MKYVKDYNAPLPEDIDWMFSILDDIEKAMQRNKPKNVACHNDYLSENFLDDGKKSGLSIGNMEEVETHILILVILLWSIHLPMCRRK